jgi:hypothetical protein
MGIKACGKAATVAEVVAAAAAVVVVGEGVALRTHLRGRRWSSRRRLRLDAGQPQSSVGLLPLRQCSLFRLDGANIPPAEVNFRICSPLSVISGVYSDEKTWRLSSRR